MLRKMFKVLADFYTEGHPSAPSVVMPQEPANGVPEAAGPSGFILPAKVPSGTPPYQGVPIPVYPDHGIAVPAAPPETLLSSQVTLIHELQQACGLSHTDFQDLLLPVIHNYACFVHLLPASESHHHCAQGGLFRHGLEVAYYAARKCEAKVFALDFPPSIRKHLEPRWVVCAVLGGLMHDIGKPLVDVGAVDATGRLVWDPFNESLYAWLARNEMKYYYIMWHLGPRNKRHEARTIYAVDRLIPRNTREWLAEYQGHTAVDAMIDALSESKDNRNPLISVIKGADSDSVARDITESRSRQGAAGTGGVRSLAARIIKTMHDQVASGEWKINEVGHVVWMTDEGTFASYPAACIQAIEILRANGENSLPVDATRVMQVLLEYGYLMQNNQEDGRTYTTWHGNLHVKEKGVETLLPIHGLRFYNSPIIPSTIVQPAPVRIDLMNASGVIVNPKRSLDAPEEAPREPEEHPEAVAPAPKANGADIGVASVTEPAADATASRDGGGRPSMPPPPPVPGQAPTGREATTADAPPASAPTGVGASTPRASADQVDSDQPNDGSDDNSLPPTLADLRDRRHEPMVRDMQLEEARENANPNWPPATADDVRHWFESQGDEGAYLCAIADRTHRRDNLLMGRDVLEHHGHIHLRYPVALEMLGVSPKDAADALERKGWMERDPANPRAATVQVQRGDTKLATIRLTERISAAFRKLLPVSGEGPTKDTVVRAFPLGPYIDARTASVLKDRKKVAPADAPHIRLAFRLFLDDETRDVAPTDDPYTPERLKEFVERFSAQHAMDAKWVRSALVGLNDGILEVIDDGSGKGRKGLRSEKLDLRMAAQYNRALDEAYCSAAIRQAEGEHA